MKTVLATALGLSLLVSGVAVAAPGQPAQHPHGPGAKAQPMPHGHARALPPAPARQAVAPARVVSAPGQLARIQPAPARPVAQRTAYHKGQRLQQGHQGQRVQDWQVRGLRGPARGQEWRQLDGRYLLVATATGVILDILAARY